MINNKFIENIKQNNSFYCKFVFNKKIRFIYYLIPTFFLITFFILGIVFISLNSNLLVPGFVFLMLTILVLIIFFVLTYYEKKMKNKVKEYFSLPNIISMNLIETEMFDRNYLSIYHSSISETREVKWCSKTYSFKKDNEEILIRFSYINSFDDNKKILINAKKNTQIYFQKTIKNINNKKIFICRNKDKENLKELKINDHVVYTKNDCSINNINSEVKKIICSFLENNINFNIIIEHDKLNIYIIENNNFLFVNNLQNFSEVIFNEQIKKMYEIIDTI